MQILDIGSGKFPWFFRQLRTEYRPPHPLVATIDFLSPTACYYCVDADDDSLKAGIQTFRERSIDDRMRQPTFEVMDGRNLSFTDATFDIVVIADVFSIPERDWCRCDDECDLWYDAHTAAREGIPKCRGEICKALSFDDKQCILNEAHRVLKPSGKLVVALYQTPLEAYRMYDHLVRDARFCRIPSLCRGEDDNENGDIYWTELVFEKQHNQSS